MPASHRRYAELSAAALREQATLTTPPLTRGGNPTMTPPETPGGGGLDTCGIPVRMPWNAHSKCAPCAVPDSSTSGKTLEFQSSGAWCQTLPYGIRKIRFDTMWSGHRSGDHLTAKSLGGIR